MKTVIITGIMADFLDSIRAYEHESGKAIHFDERKSSEFVDIYFNGGGKINIEEKEPLFITYDGVKCFDRDEYIAIGHDFCMRSMRAYNCDAPYSPDVIRFKHESNADEYIWRNKPVFSYNDFKKYQSGCEGIWYDVELLAKERISNE